MSPQTTQGAIDEAVPPDPAHSSYCYCDERECRGHQGRFPRPSAGVEFDDRGRPAWEAVFRFNLDEPEGRRALRLAIDGEAYKALVGELKEAIRGAAYDRSGPLATAVKPKAAEAVRSYLWTLLEDFGLDPDRDGGY